MRWVLNKDFGICETYVLRKMKKILNMLYTNLMDVETYQMGSTYIGNIEKGILHPNNFFDLNENLESPLMICS